MNNQRLYLQGHSEEEKSIICHRLDLMKNVRMVEGERRPLKIVPGYDGTYSSKETALSFPYMYGDEPEYITFIADEDMVDLIVDSFGEGAIIAPNREDDTRVFVVVRISPKAMEYWAKQQLDKVEIVASKTDIRARIHESLEKGLKKYKPKEK